MVFNSIEKKPSKVKGFIINARAINYIDSTASEELIIIIKKLQKKGIRVMVVGAIDPSRDIIINSKLIKVIKKQNLLLHQEMQQTVLMEKQKIQLYKKN